MLFSELFIIRQRMAELLLIHNTIPLFVFESVAGKTGHTHGAIESPQSIDPAGFMSSVSSYPKISVDSFT